MGSDNAIVIEGLSETYGELHALRPLELELTAPGQHQAAARAP